MSKVKDAQELWLLGFCLYVIALTFFLGDVPWLAFSADHVDPDRRARLGILMWAVGSCCALFGALCRHYADEMLKES